MTDEATQEGVSESGSVFGADRLAKINAIHEDRAAEREPDTEADADDALAVLTRQAEALDEELKQYGSEDEDEDEDGAETPPAAEPEPKPTEDDEPLDESPLFMEGGQWMTRVKVDGEIKVIPFARLQVAAQKLEAGDKRLEEANRLRQEIEHREQQLKLKEQQLQNQPPAQGADGQGQTETGQPTDDVKALIRQYHEALLNGEDEDATTELLEKLATAGRQQPHVDVGQLVEQVEARFSERQQQKDAQQQEALRKQALKDAYATFSTEFEDVVKDEALTKVADQFTITVSQEHPTYTPLQVMREAGKRTRLWLKEKTGTTERTNRKRNLRTAAGTNARQPGKPEEKPKTRTDQLNDIRAARGQPPIG